MNIVFVTTEAVPFAKTGGLGDVCGALPRELERLGHRTTLFLPAFRQCFQAGETIEDAGIDVHVRIGAKLVEGRVLRSRLPGCGTQVYLIQHDGYYDRAELYREHGQDYADNLERFVFFCRAVMQAIKKLELSVDVLHAHDWPAGLIPALQSLEYRQVPDYEHIATLFTIHNLAYQGLFWHWDMELTGLDWKHFNWQEMEFHGQLNLMKTGIVFADAINTVSPRYAQEIQTTEQGCGLEGVLRERAGVLSGIINGVDYETWDPAGDHRLARRYDADSHEVGKAACKAALQQELGLEANPAAPLLGFVGRLADQKGLDLITAVMEREARNEQIQWALLGSGEPQYHERLPRLAAQAPKNIAVRLGFSDELAHKIEAGADAFLMPSRYEPCGLNQLYSMRYGTPPIVRATGGLLDTIVDATPENLASGKATGFIFNDYNTLDLHEAIRRATRLYRQDPAAWKRLVQTGMRQDWSWGRSAADYVRLYEHLTAAKSTTRWRAPSVVGSR